MEKKITSIENQKEIKFKLKDITMPLKEEFNDAFSETYLKYGEGHIFEWNGQLFITKIAK